MTIQTTYPPHIRSIMALQYVDGNLHFLFPDPSLHPYFPDESAPCSIKVNGTKVPPSFPKSLSSSLVWSPGQFEDETSYVVYLDEFDKLELDKALSLFKGHFA